MCPQRLYPDSSMQNSSEVAWQRGPYVTIPYSVMMPWLKILSFDTLWNCQVLLPELYCEQQMRHVSERGLYSASLPHIAKPGSWYTLGLKSVPLPLFRPNIINLICSFMQLEISEFSTSWPFLVHIDSVAETKLYQNRSSSCVEFHC